MKNLIVVLTFLFFATACASTTPTNTAGITSPEAEAKIITDKMKESLLLASDQVDKVLMINVINLKVIRKLKETQDHEKIISTQEKYKSEIKDVLNSEQYSKFLGEFKSL